MFLSVISFTIQKWINRGGEKVVINQNSCDLSPKLKMFSNVVCLYYWKFFCPADAVLVGVLTSSRGLHLTQEPWKPALGIIWHCRLSSAHPFLFCAPLPDRRVSPGISLLPVLAHLCYFAHAASSEGYKEDFCTPEWEHSFFLISIKYILSSFLELAFACMFVLCTPTFLIYFF